MALYTQKRIEDEEGHLEKLGKELPKYVTLGDEATVLRLIKTDSSYRYFRDAGYWWVDIEISDIYDTIYSVCHRIPLLHGKELRKATEEDWLKSNRGYV